MKTTLTHFIPGYKYLSDETLTALIHDLQSDLRAREGDRASRSADWEEFQKGQPTR